MPKGIRKAQPTTVKVGDESLQVRVPSQRKQPPLETQNLAEPQSGRGKDSQGVSQRTTSATRGSGVGQTSERPFFEILGMHRGIVEVAKMIQVLQGRGVQLDQVQLYWIMLEDPHYTVVPAGPNERGQHRIGAKISWTVSEESNSEQRIPPGPSLEGHPATHENAVPCAPPEMRHAGVIKRMHEVISLTLVKNRGIRRSDMVMGALDSENLPAEKDRALRLLQGSPQYTVASGEETEVILVPSEDWPNHRSYGVLVACSRPQGYGKSARRVPHSWSGCRVTCPMREGHGFTGAKDSAARWVEVVVMWT